MISAEMYPAPLLSLTSRGSQVQHASVNRGSPRHLGLVSPVSKDRQNFAVPEIITPSAAGVLPPLPAFSSGAGAPLQQ
jgi:hypothetical protein